MPPASEPNADWLEKRRRLDALLRLQAAVMSGDPAHHEAVRLLADSLGDVDDEIRELAATALAEFGPDAQIALPELIQATTDENATVRRRAIRTIGFIGPIAAEDAIPAVEAASEDADDSVALQAIATLGEFGPMSAPAIPVMLAAIWTGDARKRAVAGAALQRVGEAAIPSLIQTLVHPSAEVRAKVAHILGKIGPGAAEARYALESLLHDQDEGARQAAQEALDAISAASAHP
jgi:HEAT repeat protein